MKTSKVLSLALLTSSVAPLAKADDLAQTVGKKAEQYTALIQEGLTKGVHALQEGLNAAGHSAQEKGLETKHTLQETAQAASRVALTKGIQLGDALKEGVQVAKDTVSSAAHSIKDNAQDAKNGVQRSVHAMTAADEYAHASVNDTNEAHLKAQLEAARAEIAALKAQLNKQ